MTYLFAPILVVLGMMIYQVSQKTTNENANPFVVVIMAYVVGIIACVGGYFLLPRQDAASFPMMKTAG